MRTMQSNTAWQSCVAPEVANNNKTSKTYGSERKKESTKDQRLLQFSCNHVNHVKWLYLLVCVNFFQREAHQSRLDLNTYAMFIHYYYRNVGLGHRMFLVFLA